MTFYLSNRDGNGKTSEEGHYRMQTRVFDGGVLHVDDLKVTQNSPLGLSVLVGAGDYRIDSGLGYAYTGWNTASAPLTIPTADPANPRITCVVLYIDKGAATSASPPNNPGIAKLMAVNGTPASSPVAPNSTVIQAAVGSGNPYMILANVTVPAAATQIINSNISDQRTRIKLTADVLSAYDLGNILYPIGSIYANYSNSTNPGTLLGFGTWVAIAGRVIVGLDATQTEFDTAGETGGEKAHTLTTTEMPAHAHNIRVKNDDFNFTSGSAGVGPTFADARDGTTALNNFSGIVQSAGSGGAHNNLQPYVVAYLWRRTA
jgi:baseplate structural protein gp10